MFDYFCTQLKSGLNLNAELFTPQGPQLNKQCLHFYDAKEENFLFVIRLLKEYTEFSD